MILRSGKRKHHEARSPPSVHPSVAKRRRPLPPPRRKCPNSPPSRLAAVGTVESPRADGDLTPDRHDGAGPPGEALPPSSAAADLPVDPVSRWAQTGHWADALAAMNQDESVSSRKRSHSGSNSRSTSYSQSFKDGNVPRAHSQAYENVLAFNGIFMEESKGRSLVAPQSKDMCHELQQYKYANPAHPAFPLSRFMDVWEQAQRRNEARVYRDLTPLLVPSPELQYLSGAEKLQYIAEDINTEWTKSPTLGGPRPKPDLAIGISTLAFDEEETVKLKNYTAFERPTLFTDNLYFPFLLCEVKCGNEGINRADRQNMHSSSLSVKAIVDLVRHVDEAEAQRLSGQVLAFSVSHDNERVKIYGHFAVVTRDRTTFYRYPVNSFILNFDAKGWKKCYSFVQAIYYVFYPEHIARIRRALGQMADPRKQAMPASAASSEEAFSRDEERALALPDTVEFRKPGAPASAKHKEELAFLRTLLTEQKEQNQEQMKQSQEQLRTLREQLREQQTQSHEQLRILQDQIKTLQRLLERQ